MATSNAFKEVHVSAGFFVRVPEFSVIFVLTAVKDVVDVFDL
jgi:hypothetical protein